MESNDKQHRTDTVMALTAKQRDFARLVAEGRSQAEAYRLSHDIRPDSKPETHYTQGWKLMQKPEVRQRVQEVIAAREGALIRSSLSDRDAVLQKFRDLMENATPKDAVQLRAAEALGKAVGLFEKATEERDEDDPGDLLGEIVAELDLLADDMSQGALQAPDDRHRIVPEAPDTNADTPPPMPESRSTK